MTASLLLIDAGNTRIKWARVEGSRWIERGIAFHDDLGSLAEAGRNLGDEGQCWIASVAGETRNRVIERSLPIAGLTLHWLETGERQCGVINHYSPPQQLGVDRWMALLGARQRSRETCLVVSAGTAMTVDALTAEGHFRGGIIVPGRELMETSLSHGTALVGQAAGQVRPFPCNTADAVRSGSVTALAGAVTLMHARLAALGEGEPRCLVTGGDAGLVLPLLSFPAEQVAELVLEGIHIAASAGDQE